jgi:hypothetical protein
MYARVLKKFLGASVGACPISEHPNWVENSHYMRANTAATARLLVFGTPSLEKLQGTDQFLAHHAALLLIKHPFCEGLLVSNVPRAEVSLP